MNKSSSELPEIIFSASENRGSRQISQLLRQKYIHKIAPKIYTSNLKDSVEEIIYRNRYLITSHLFPGAIISHRTAFEGDVKPGEILFLTYHHRHKVSLPGLAIQLTSGFTAKEGTNPFIETLYISGYERILLENLQPTRKRTAASKTVEREAVEQRLETFYRIRGEKELNRLREQAKAIAGAIGMNKEYGKLDKIIAAILGTSPNQASNPTPIFVKGLPYDSYRVERFMSLHAVLRTTVLPVRQLIETEEVLKNIAFFEAYFSNHIEGTGFEPDEAADIVFENRPLAHRQKDSHDIIATHSIVSNFVEMQSLPDSPEAFEALLKKRHALLLAAREDKRPGEFQEIVNQTSNTVFVSPELVRGTLAKGFDLYRLLDNPFARAAFIMFVVTEIHPFLDGNGRLARIMMNAELVHAEQCRIIIPSVFHEDCLLTLRRLSREGDAKPYVNMLDKAQALVSKIDFSNYETAMKMLSAYNAFAKHNEGGLLKMPNESSSVLPMK